VGIGYDDEIARAQQIAIGILRAHTAVLEDPEPLVLVESLGAATVNLRVYFWINVELYGRLKVKSSVIRQIKLAFDQAEISMPDEAREVVFPAGVPVIVESEVPRVTTHDERKAGRSPVGSGAAATTGGSEGEGDLGSDTRDLKTQAENSRDPEGGRNLLT
jgi:small-conductance mechanosensitive channel